MTGKVDLFAAAPQQMKSWFAASSAIAASLDPTLAHLVKIRASQINGCANCINMHTAEAREKGETEQRLYLLSAWREAPCYTKSERAALGRFVLRTKEYLTIVRARRERLTLTTMRFHDEVSEPPKTPSKRPAKKPLDTTVKLIEALSEPWDPTRYRDEYEKRLKKIIRDKQKGKTVKEPEREEQPSPIEDLMAALERSLEEVK